MATERLNEEYGPCITTTSKWLQSIGVVAFFTFWTMPLTCVAATAYVAFYAEYWYVAYLYCAWIYYDRETPNTGGRRWNYKWRLPFARWFSSYFPVLLVKTHELDPRKNYIFAGHPHGILSFGSVSGLTEANNFHLAFPGLQNWYMVLRFIFYVPIFREIVLSTGGCAISREGLAAILSKRGGGNIAIMLPGGAREALNSRPGENRIILKNRKGFIRTAIENGACVVPCYCFGETDTYWQLSNPEGSRLRRFQEWVITTTGLAPTLVYGRGLLRIFPRRVPLTAVGAPIEVEKNSCPTMEEVNVLHERYVVALTDLYYTYRQKYGNSGSELNII